MRVIVAGSSGLIGTSLVSALRESGHEVIRLVRRMPRTAEERAWDPDRRRFDDSVLVGADAVVNLCGAPFAAGRWTRRRKRLLVNSRVRPTALLAEAVARRQVPTLLNGSAVGYYGDTGQQHVTEESPRGQGFLADLCRQWEAATAPAAEAGSRVALLRTGLVLAPSGGLLAPLKPLFRLALGGRLGSGQQYMSWISVTDEVGAIQFVLDHPEIAGPVNLTGPEPVTNREFTKEFGQALGRPAPWVAPAFALRLVLGQLAEEAALSGQRVLPTVLEQHGYPFQHSSPRDALASAVGGSAAGGDNCSGF